MQRVREKDQVLQATIIDVLKADPNIEAERVTVSVGTGAVRLSGNVASLAEKIATVRSVLRVRGVLAVADNLTVRKHDDAETS